MDATMELPRVNPISKAVQVVGDGGKPIRVIASRGYTVVILALSLILLETVIKDKTAAEAPAAHFSVGGRLASQRFVFFAIIIGCACNLLQLGIVMYCMKSIKGKAMATSKYRIFFDYYVDKVVSIMLGVTVGAALGSSIDISQLKALKHNLFSISKISIALMATVLLSTSISYSCSEEAVKKYRESLDKGEEAVGIFRSWATKVYNFFGIKFNS